MILYFYNFNLLKYYYYYNILKYKIKIISYLLGEKKGVELLFFLGQKYL